jgi:hypothetical protein
MTVERSGWMTDVAQVRQCLTGAPLWGGGASEANVAEALADCIFLLDQVHRTSVQIRVLCSCILRQPDRFEATLFLESADVSACT